MSDERILIRQHAWQRMAARGITTAEILAVLAAHDIIEDYPDDTPYPSALLLATVNGRPLHVVRAYDVDTQTVFVITAYQPDPAEWDTTFRKRVTR